MPNIHLTIEPPYREAVAAEVLRRAATAALQHEGISSAALSLLITDSETVRRLNARYRGIDAPTDVLSFPLEPVAHVPLGELVISVEYAANRASEYENSLDNEIALLFIHGLLHLLGYDHETDRGEMRKREEALIRRFNLPESLIVRTEGDA
jgi:probable rRNA maturation factor